MQLFRRLSFTMLLMSMMTLVACGGGDGDLTGGGDGGGGTSDAVTLTVVKSDGDLSAANDVTVSATVVENGSAVVNKTVTFTLAVEGSATFDPVSSTATTDANGIATIIVKVTDVKGSVNVIASYESATDNISFNSAGDGDGTDLATILSISISDSNVTEQSPATISVTVLADGEVVIGEVVTFTTTLGSFSPETGTALTGDGGIATIVLNGGDVSGAGTVTANVSSSESVSVGFTTQAAGSIVLKLGAGEPFVEGEILVSLSPLSAGGTSVISVSLVDEQNQLYAESAEFTFTSLCSAQTTPTASLDSPIVTSNGKAESVYFAKGCVGDDPITVNVVVNGQNLSATGSIEVLSAALGSIQFVSATPEHIAIQGAGSDERPESATVIFKVLDTNSNPLSGKDVTFSLSSTIGGIILNPINATTNNEGLVQTVVNSGTVARTVRVLASVDDSDPVIQTQSGELKISTGIPDQDSMSIAASNLAPRAWNHDGVEVTLTARLGDAFNNPPPATAVYFTTEGGSIENLDASCTTGDDGSCSVIWRSQYPRPVGHILGDVNNPNQVPKLPLANNKGVMGQNYGGRVTILATTIGEESFPDLNGNGRFDVCELPAFLGTTIYNNTYNKTGNGKPCLGDGSFDDSADDIPFSYLGKDVSGRFYDIGEAFADYNEDGVFNQLSGAEAGGELEELVDFNQNGVYDGKDGKYNGILCAIPAHDGCAAETSLDIKAQMVIVMSGDTPYICVNSSFDSGVIAAGDESKLTAYSASSREFCENKTDDTFAAKQHRDNDDKLFLAPKASGSVVITMADLHNQPMPAGTEVSFKSSVGSVTSGTSDWEGNRNGGSQFFATIKAGEDIESGTLDVILTFEGGDKVTVRVADIYIQ
ncbi:hypothetical protein [Colwellia psychrerythraea]|uniref:Intimin/invasin family protein n=1 Tax=Colwellia psychrerythraea (strain 34H / ATCC BAA-681) TaxID=167879 RepID=Q486S7_COLP3|nr:hypothetical protein [Colwellia psychrerythraea]AAZ25952.1 intimin/invasin family protein [Colwellia psychrerythraea 34H]